MAYSRIVDAGCVANEGIKTQERIARRAVAAFFTKRSRVWRNPKEADTEHDSRKQKTTPQSGSVDRSFYG